MKKHKILINIIILLYIILFVCYLQNISCNKLAENTRIDMWTSFYIEKSFLRVALRRSEWKPRAFYIRTWVHCHVTLKSTNERSFLSEKCR